MCEGTAALPVFARAYEAARQSHSILSREEALLTLYRAIGVQQERPATVETGKVDQAVMLLRERFAEQVSVSEAAGLVTRFRFYTDVTPVVAPAGATQ